MVAISVISLAIAAQTAAWKPVTSLHAFGEERLAGGSKRSFEVHIKDGIVAVDTSQAIDGKLSGVPRREVRSSDGTYTWLNGQPGWALQRAISSAGEYTSMFTPPAFSPADLRKGPVWLERQFGVKVKIDRPEKVAGRFCEVLRFTERSASVKTIWIDQETGLTLRTQEATGDQVFAERTVTDLRFDEQSQVVAKPGDARIIRGIPSGGVLQYVDQGRSAKEYQADLDTVRKSTKLGNGSWIKKLPEIPGFDYALSEWHESLGSLAANKPAQGTEQATVSGDVTFVIGSAQTSGERVAVVSKLVEMQAAELAIAGSKVALFMNIESAIPPEETAAGANAFVQSDFIDRKTGDTVSFLQLRNSSLGAATKGVRLPQPLPEKDKQLGEIRVYEVVRPFKMTIVHWGTPGGQYALVSTRHSAKELIDLARKCGHG
jgi:hypothetical protein